MSDYARATVGSGYNTAASLNTELSKVETAIASKLDSDGGTMSGDLDMNSNDILNADDVFANNIYINGGLIVPSDTFDLVIPTNSILTGKITATAGQTAFTVPSYTVGANTIFIYVNGQYQYIADSYIETSATVITFSTGLNLDDEFYYVINQVAATTGVVGGANLIEYTPNIAGGVKRLLQAKLEEVISVKDFGAIGDGATDDTTAIQAAVDYAAPLGRSVYFPKGTYNIADHILLPAGGDMSLLGEGKYVSILKATAETTETNGGFFVLIGTGAEDIVIRDMTIEVDHATYTSIDYAVYIENAKTFLTEDCVYDGGAIVSCYVVTGNVNSIANRCHVQNYASGGIFFKSADYQLIETCSADGSGVGSPLQCQGSENTVQHILHCTVDGGVQGPQIRQGASGSMRGNRLRNQTSKGLVVGADQRSFDVSDNWIIRDDGTTSDGVGRGIEVDITANMAGSTDGDVDPDAISLAQTLGSATNLTITGADTSGGSFNASTVFTSEDHMMITLTAVSDERGVEFTVSGTDVTDEAKVITYFGPNAETMLLDQFKTVTQIATDGATTGNVSVGLSDQVNCKGSTISNNHIVASDSTRFLDGVRVTGAHNLSMNGNDVNGVSDNALLFNNSCGHIYVRGGLLEQYAAEGISAGQAYAVYLDGIIFKPATTANLYARLTANDSVVQNCIGFGTRAYFTTGNLGIITSNNIYPDRRDTDRVDSFNYDDKKAVLVLSADTDQQVSCVYDLVRSDCTSVQVDLTMPAIVDVGYGQELAFEKFAGGNSLRLKGAVLDAAGGAVADLVMLPSGSISAGQAIVTAGVEGAVKVRSADIAGTPTWVVVESNVI